MILEHVLDAPLPCLASAPLVETGYLATPLPALDDPEGERVALDLPPVVDAHVHLFDDQLFEAIWRWFDRWGWPIRYKLFAPEVIEFLRSRGVAEIVAMSYAHKPGVAEGMNRLMAEICRAHPAVTGLGTVFPGEPDARGVVERAFAAGLAGVKLHCHVQCFAPDAAELDEIYRTCAEHGRPLVMHAGREPKSPGYRCDPHAICSAERVARVLGAHPKLELVVPHLGADEFDAYARLLERVDNLWVDTTMALAGYFPGPVPYRLLEVRPERVLYGTDFPNIPYAWDRELRRIAASGIPERTLARVLGENARALFSLPARA